MIEPYKRKTNWSLYLRLSVGLMLIGVLVFSVGFTELFEKIVEVDLPVAIVAICCSLLYFFIGGFNIWILLRSVHPIPFKLFLKSYAYCYTVNLFAPGQIGDLSLAFFLKKQGIPMKIGGSSYLLDKLISLLFLSILSFYGAYLLIPQFTSVYLLIVPVVIVATTLMFFMIFLKIKFSSQYLVKIQQWIVGSKGVFLSFSQKKIIIFQNLIGTLFKWFVLSIFCYFAFYSFGLSVKWPEISLIPIMSTFIGYLPISLGGIGTVEYAAVFLFSKIGVGKTEVVTTYLFMRAIQYLQAIVLFYVLCRQENEKIGCIQKETPR